MRAMPPFTKVGNTVRETEEDTLECDVVVGT
jgi:hypothetical protein